MKIKSKSIAFRMKSKHYESVNRNGNDSSQGYALMPCVNVYMDKSMLARSNVTYNKHNFVPIPKDKLSEGDWKIKIALPKISEDCIRNAIFKDQIAPVSLPVLSLEDQISAIASEAYLLRGYFLTDDRTVKRTSVLNIKDAVCIGEAPTIVFETHSNEGNKEENIHGENKSNSNFFVIESCGEWESSTKGLLDLVESQFLPMDSIFGRCAIYEDDFVLFEDSIKKRYGEGVKMGYFRKKTQNNLTPEKGIMLTDKTVTQMAKYLLNRILHFEIIKTKASMYATSVEIKIRNDENAGDLYSCEEGWMPLTQELIDNLEIEVDSCYVEVPATQAEKQTDIRNERKELIAALNNTRSAKAEEKEEKKATGKKSASSRK